MQEARARFQRDPESDEGQLQVELNAASALGYDTAASSRRHLVAIDGGAEAISRFETADFDEDFFGVDDDPLEARSTTRTRQRRSTTRTRQRRPTTRTRQRRPTGAAADYARGYSDGRRTVRIGGRGSQTSALRPTPSELRGPRPDRVAGWAFGFGIFVAILAIVTGGA
jgi:hypothetical protein